MGQRKNLEWNLKNFETIKNENTTYENLWDSAKAVQEKNILAISIYIKRKISYKQIALQLNEPEKEQSKPKVTRRKKIMKIS